MKKLVKIEGIYCEECKHKIKAALLKNDQVQSVKIKNNIATIYGTSNLKNKDIIKIINDLDYFTKDEYIKDDEEEINPRIKLYEFLIIAILFILISFVISKIFGYNIFNVIPTIDSNITYGMLFLTGLFTSIHCLSMCGAIHLTAIYSEKNNIKKPLFYNLGRLISYTCLGGLVGFVGHVLEINDTFKGIIIIIASIIMLLMSLKLLGIIDFKPLCLKNKKIKTDNAFLLGLLNGLMPCGPLQAMQVYALSTGSALKGALAMFLFCLGTIPLMMAIGILFNILKGKWKIIVNKIAAVLVFLLSLIMLNRGLRALNIDLFKNYNEQDYLVAQISNNEQIVEFDLDYNNYQDIIVEENKPVKIIIHVAEDKLTGCNYKIMMRDFNIEQELVVGDNIITFTPTKVGTYQYTCYMDMIKNNIKVVPNLAKYQK